MTNSFPVIANPTYPGVPYYYVAVDANTEYTCSSADSDNGFTNVQCLTSGQFDDSKVVDCSSTGNCAYATCGVMEEALCPEPTEMYDSNSTYKALCVAGGDQGKCKEVTIATIARPTDDTDRSATEINKWYVGDSSYVTGYSYKCDNTTDNVGAADTPYMNGLCLNSTGDAIDENKTIYCQDPQSDGLGAAAVSVTADCTLTECGKVNSDWCADGFDLYKLEGSTVVYSDTCVKDTDDDTNAFCVSISSAMSTTVGIVAGFIVMAGLL